MRTLYHYTSLAAMRHILEDGAIRGGNPLLRETSAPQTPVVWLTTDAECKYAHALAPLDGALGVLAGAAEPDNDRTRVRFTVALPNMSVHKWRQWNLERGGDPGVRGGLIKASGGGSWTWRVVERPIMSDRWAEVLDRVTGDLLWRPTRRPVRARCDECGQLLVRDTVNDGHKMDCSEGPRNKAKAVIPVSISVDAGFL